MMSAIILGLLVSLIFSVVQISRACRSKTAQLFRGQGINFFLGSIRKEEVFYLLSLVLTLCCFIVLLSPDRSLALWFIGGAISSFGILNGLATLIKLMAASLSSAQMSFYNPALKLALVSLGNENKENRSVLLSIGVGLIVLGTMSQIERSLQNALSNDLPSKAPTLFLVDIQSDQKLALKSLLMDGGLVNGIETAPMLRGW